MFNASGDSPDAFFTLINAPGDSPDAFFTLINAPGDSPDGFHTLINARGDSPDGFHTLINAPGDSPDGFHTYWGGWARSRDFRDHCIFAVALGTGLREHEIAALSVDDVHTRMAASGAGSPCAPSSEHGARRSAGTRAWTRPRFAPSPVRELPC